MNTLNSKLKLIVVGTVCLLMLSPLPMMAQTGGTNLLFTKRVQACEGPQFTRSYAFTSQPTFQGSATGSFTCNFNLSYNSSSSASMIALNFTPTSCFATTPDGTTTSVSMQQTVVNITPSGLRLDATYPADQATILRSIMGTLFFDLAVSGASDPISSFTVGSNASVISSGVFFSTATITSTTPDHTATFQFQPGSTPQPKNSSDAANFAAQLSPPFTGSITLSQDTGLVESGNITMSYSAQGSQGSESYSIGPISSNTTPSTTPH